MAPPTRSRPPTGNPGSATAMSYSWPGSTGPPVRKAGVACWETPIQSNTPFRVTPTPDKPPHPGTITTKLSGGSFLGVKSVNSYF